jgi:hypothetical protein
VGAFLVAVVMVGCASAQRNIDDERGGEEGAEATNEETTEPAGIDAEVVSPLGEADMPAGFGEGSLWATGFKPCNDVIGDSASASATSQAGCPPGQNAPQEGGPADRRGGRGDPA